MMKHNKISYLLFIAFLHSNSLLMSKYNAIIKKLKQQADNYYLWQSSQQQEQTSVIKILQYYQDMPTQANTIKDWISHHPKILADLCFDAYRTQAKKDLDLLNSVIEQNYLDSNTLRHLHQLKEYILDSFSVTEELYQKELVIKRDMQDKDRMYELRKREVIAQENLVQEQRNIRIVQQEETRRIAELITILNVTNLRNIKDENIRSIDALRKAINRCSLQVGQITIEKNTALIQLRELITIVEQAELYQQLQTENKRLHQYQTQCEQDLREAQAMIREILHQQTNSKITHPTESQLQKLTIENQKLRKNIAILQQAQQHVMSEINRIINNAQTSEQKAARKELVHQVRKQTRSDEYLPQAHAVQANEQDVYNGPIVVATLIDENQEHKQLRKR